MKSNENPSTNPSIIEKLQALLDTEVNNAKEREDATKFAMETCRRKLERLIDDSNDQAWVTTLSDTLSQEPNNLVCKPVCEVGNFINKAAANKSGPKVAILSQAVKIATSTPLLLGQGQSG